MAFLSNKKELVGLDIGSRTIKVAEVEEKKRGRHLKRIGMVDIEPGLIEDGMIRQPEPVAEILRDLWKAQRIKTRNVAISIGGYSTIVKNINVQKMEDAQLHQTIRFEAEQYIPFDINDVNIDFQIVGESENNPNQMNVLLVAAKKEMVLDYVNLLDLSGLNTLIIDVDAFALQNIYEISYQPENENVALIEIGNNKTTLNIVGGSNSVFMRDVSLGCHQISQRIMQVKNCSLEEAERLYHDDGSDHLASKETIEIVTSVIADWCTEIRRALDFFYSTYPDEQIRKIILSGGGANIKRLRDRLSMETSSDVEIIRPLETFSVEGRFDPAYLEKIGPQAAIAIGLAIRKA